MATKNATIKIKRSTIANAVPTTSNLSVGELAINHADGKLYAVTTVANVVTGVTQINSTGGGGSYNAANVAITGGTIDGTAIGNTSQASVSAAALNATGVVNFNHNSDATSSTAGGTLTVNGGLGVSMKAFIGTDLTVGGMVYESIETISAAGSTQSNAQLIAKTVTNVTSVGSGQGIRLPVPSRAGGMHYIINNGTSPLKVYPASSASIDGNAQNVAITIPVGQNVGLVADTTSNWYSFIDATTAGSSNNIVVSHPAAGLTIDLANTVVLSGNITSANFSGNVSGNHAGTSYGVNTGDQDLSGLVPKTTTVNGHALTGNITISASDVGAQEVLTAGTNITITGNVIAASGGGGSVDWANVAITGGSVDGTAIGNTTPSTGHFTAIDCDNLTVLHDSLVDGVTIGIGPGGTSGQPVNLVLGTNNYPNNTTGYGLICIGSDNLASHDSGAFALCVGANNMNSNTTGGGNTALGAYNLNNNVDGSNNFAVGGGVLFSNVSGNSNLGLGNNAIANKVEGNNNTAVGISALGYVKAAANNVVMGYAAMQGVGTGTSVTAGSFVVGTNYLITSVGTTNFSALGGANTVGTGFTATGVGSGTGTAVEAPSGNTAVGYQSMFSMKAGGRNCAFGTQSLYSLSTGYSNQAIGYSSLRAVTTGMMNIGIGHQAGYGGSGGLTTGSNSIYIGANSKASAGTATNEIVIGGVTSGSNTGLGDNTIKIGNSSTALTYLSGILMMPQHTPTTSVGDGFEKAGMVAIDAAYIYVCVADYDGSTNVWTRTAYGTDTW